MFARSVKIMSLQGFEIKVDPSWMAAGFCAPTFGAAARVFFRRQGPRQPLAVRVPTSSWGWGCLVFSADKAVMLRSHP